MVTLTIGGSHVPSSFHVWRTQFGWDGMKQTQSTYFQQLPDVKVMGGTVTINVTVDSMITLTTQKTSARCLCCPRAAGDSVLTMWLWLLQTPAQCRHPRHHSRSLCRTRTTSTTTR